jgi:hypothetical protein
MITRSEDQLSELMVADLAFATDDQTGDCYIVRDFDLTQYQAGSMSEHDLKQRAKIRVPYSELPVNRRDILRKMYNRRIEAKEETSGQKSESE